MGQHEVVAQIHGIPRPWDEVVHVRYPALQSLLSDLKEQGYVDIKANEALPELKRYTRTVKARAWLNENGY